MVVFEDKRWTRQKKSVPKNGPKNGLRKDSKIVHFGIHFRGTKMGHFSDLKNGPTQPKEKSLLCIRVSTGSTFGTPHQKIWAPENGPENGPQCGI